MRDLSERPGYARVGGNGRKTGAEANKSVFPSESSIQRNKLEIFARYAWDA